MFSTGGTRFWFGALYDILVPMTIDSKAVEEDSITNTSFYGAALGMDFVFEPWLFTVQGEYGIFPPSDEVASTSIGVKLGLGYSF